MSPSPGVRDFQGKEGNNSNSSSPINKITSIKSNVSPRTKVKKDLCPTVLKDKGYSIGALIGDGGFSKVYRAAFEVPNEEKQELAVKIIHLTEVSTEWKEKSLPNELKIASLIGHPNIVEIHSIFKTQHNAYIFMGWAKDTVTAFMNRQAGVLSEKRVRYWFNQLLLAVDYLHGKGIAHRDLKTENLLLDNECNIRVTDFGFACFVHKQGEKKPVLSTTSCGTHEYMAPEVSMEPVLYDPQLADMWSCGIILYELLTKRLPFEKDDQIIKKQLKRRWKFPQNVTVSEEAKKLTKLLLDPVPTRRPDAKDALADAWFQIKTKSKDIIKGSNERTKEKNLERNFKRQV